MNAHGSQAAPPSGTVACGPLTTWHDGAPACDVLMQMGNCQLGVPFTTRAMEGSVKKRWLVSVSCDRAPSQRSVTFTTGTPDWFTNAGRMRSTGFPEVAAIAVQKSSDVALP